MAYNPADREPLERTIKEYNIDVNTPDNGTQVPCPLCAEKRTKKGTKTCMITVVRPGFVTYNCAHCGDFSNGMPVGDKGDFKKSKKTTAKKPAKPEQPKYNIPYPIKPTEWTTEAAQWLEARGIKENTRVSFGVCLSNYPMKWIADDESSKNSVSCLTIPYYDNKVIKCIKYREFGTKNHKQSWKPEPILFNIDRFRDYLDENKIGNTAFICEGEWDVMILAQTGRRQAVSVPGGASKKNNKSRAELLLKYKHLFVKCETLYLAGDNDGPGEDLSHHLAVVARKINPKILLSRVNWGHCCTDECMHDTNEKDENDQLLRDSEGKVLQVGCKDANDTFLNHGAQGLSDCIAYAKDYELPCIENAEPFNMDDEPATEVLTQRVNGALNQFIHQHSDIYLIHDPVADEDTFYMEWVSPGYWEEKREKAIKDYLMDICNRWCGKTCAVKLRGQVFPLVKTFLRTKRKTILREDINTSLNSIPFKNKEKSLSLSDIRGIIDTPKEDYMTISMNTTSQEATMDHETWLASEWCQMQRDWHPTMEEKEVFFQEKPLRGNEDKIESISDMWGGGLMGNFSRFAMLCVGSGSDGKSVDIDCRREAFGSPLFKSVGENVFLRVAGIGRHRSEREGLSNSRFAVITEVTDKSSCLIGGNVKDLAGPNTINVDPMHKSSREEKVALMPVIVSNYDLDMKDVAIGMQKRIKLVRYDNVQNRPDGVMYPGDRQHSISGKQLLELQKRVRGCVVYDAMQAIVRWHLKHVKFGQIQLCDEIKNNTREIFEKENTLMSALRQVAHRDPNGFIFLSNLDSALSYQCHNEYMDKQWGKRGVLSAEIKSNLDLKADYKQRSKDGGKWALHGWSETTERNPRPVQKTLPTEAGGVNPQAPMSQAEIESQNPANNK